ncbi:MAG: DUF72 domain-containing protein [Gammaproteobacteria bacterium]
MGRIRVGTTSWTEKTLVESGLFYPSTVKTPEARLNYYASKFPITEVDSSYYALPSERNAAAWVERTPKDFVFHVKAFRLFTRHPTEPSKLPKDLQQALLPAGKKNLYYDDVPPEITDELWARFRGALQPLQAAGKLGTVLCQFPAWFIPNRDGYAHLLLCAERLHGMPVAVEFRNAIWFDERRRERVLGFLREHQLVHVVVDEPQGFRSSLPAVWEITSPQLALVRFHGRNKEMWEKKALSSAAERFNYLYSQAELRNLARYATELAEKAAETHALFNNCYRDYGQRNAMEFQRLLNLD